MDEGAWWAAVHGDTRSRTRLSDFTLFFSLSCIGEGNGNPLQCSCLESPSDGGTWWAAVYGVAQSRTRLKRLSSNSSSILGKGAFVCMCLVIQSCQTLCDPLDCTPQISLSMEFSMEEYWSKKYCYFLLQRIFPTQGWKLCLLFPALEAEDFPGGSDGKASVYNAEDPGLIPGSGISPGEGNGNPLQYYCLENPMDRGDW